MAGSPAPNSFEEMSRSLRLYVPQLPYPLAQQFIRDRYRRILELRTWSGSRAEGEFLVTAAETTGTVALTFNNSTVTGTGTSFLSTDVGRQFKGGSGSPVYSITAVNTGAQTLTLDRPYGGDTVAASTYTVFNGYVIPPTDFLSFLAVTDPRNAWRLVWWITQDELNRWDPQRVFFGQAYALVDRRFDTTTGQPQFELWPYNTAQRNYPFYYYKRVPDLVQDTDIPIWPIRSDVIVYGALADLCLWPGTPEKPNPLFGSAGKIALAEWKYKYDDGLVELERRDEEIFLTWLATASNMGYPFAPLSASFIQSHAV
jgi:hypothetical protein